MSEAKLAVEAEAEATEPNPDHPSRTVYVTDELGVWTGETVKFGFFEGHPSSWSSIEPPTTAEGQFAVWDGFAWSIVDERPQAARAPVSLAIGTLWDRLTDAEWDALDAAMAGEHRRLNGLWNTPTHVMADGDNLWTVIAGHLNAIVSEERKAELLAG